MAAIPDREKQARRRKEHREEFNQRAAIAGKILDTHIANLRMLHAAVKISKNDEQLNAWHEALAGFVAGLQPYVETFPPK